MMIQLPSVLAGSVNEPVKLSPASTVTNRLPLSVQAVFIAVWKFVKQLLTPVLTALDWLA
jgi:hypothetical protein